MIRGTVVPFQTKLAQAGHMLIEIADHFRVSLYWLSWTVGLAMTACGKLFEKSLGKGLISCPVTM